MELAMGMRLRPPTAMGTEEWRPQRRPPPTTVAMTKAHHGRGMKMHPSQMPGMYPMSPAEYSPYSYPSPHGRMGMSRGAPMSHYGMEYPRWEQEPGYPRGPCDRGTTMSRLYKTKICKTWKEQGSCPYNERCIFAHNAAELRELGFAEAEALQHFEAAGVRLHLKPDDVLLLREE